MKSSMQWELFCREAEIAAISLYDGFNYQLKANEYQKAFYSKSFFSLSIGFERIFKLIILLDYLNNNEGKLPPENLLKNYGHNIVKTYNEVKEIASRYENIEILQALNEINQSEIQSNILKEIENFSKKTRYHNLNNLTNNQNDGPDPIESWNTNVAGLISKKYPCKKFNIAIEKYFRTQDPFDLSYAENIAISHQQRYTTQQIVLIAKPLVSLLIKLQNITQQKGMDVPYLEEFFVMLSFNSKSKMLKKRRWELYF